MLLSGETIQMPAFSGWESDKLGMLVPFLLLRLPVVHAAVSQYCVEWHDIQTDQKGERCPPDKLRGNVGGRRNLRFLQWDV